MLHYFVLYKPYGVICQFTPEVAGQQTLKDLYPFPTGVYPVGRLDLDSEGLLLLTDDAHLNTRLLHPTHAHQRTYLVQVEGIPTPDALHQLKNGVAIKLKNGTYRTKPANIHLLDTPPPLPERIPPVRFRRHIPTSWLEIQLIEGKNRQVRKMCAKVGFPVLRLVRIAIEQLPLGSLQPGAVRQTDRDTLYRLLRISGK